MLKYYKSLIYIIYLLYAPFHIGSFLKIKIINYFHKWVWIKCTPNFLIKPCFRFFFFNVMNKINNYIYKTTASISEHTYVYVY